MRPIPASTLCACVPLTPTVIRKDAFEYYVTDDGKQYGMKCFYVQDGGKVVEDTYEEG